MINQQAIIDFMQSNYASDYYCIRLKSNEDIDQLYSISLCLHNTNDNQFAKNILLNKGHVIVFIGAEDTSVIRYAFSGYNDEIDPITDTEIPYDIAFTTKPTKPVMYKLKQY